VRSCEKRPGRVRIRAGADGLKAAEVSLEAMP